MSRLALIIAGGVLLLAMLLVLWWVLFIRPAHDRQAAAQAKAGATIAQGQAAAGKDAVGVVVNTAGKEAQTDEQTRRNAATILGADGAASPVPSAVDAAGRNAICMRRSARATAACQRLLHPGS